MDVDIIHNFPASLSMSPKCPYGHFRIIQTSSASMTGQDRINISQLFRHISHTSHSTALPCALPQQPSPSCVFPHSITLSTHNLSGYSSTQSTITPFPRPSTQRDPLSVELPAGPTSNPPVRPAIQNDSIETFDVFLLYFLELQMRFLMFR